MKCLKKKILVLLSVLCLSVSSALAAVQLKVTAEEEFQTDNPADYIDARLRETSFLGQYTLPINSVLHCRVMQIVDPKRGKRNATFFVQPVSYTYKDRTFEIKEEMYGKYSKKVLSTEELKKIPPSKVIQNTALMVGNYFIKGLSMGVSFVKGVVGNEEDNRIKSGVVKVYKDSPLSYFSEGEQLDIQPGDDFYLIFKIEEDSEPNYTYTMEES